MLKKILCAAVLIGGMSSFANAALINASDYFKGLITAGTTTQSATNLWQLGHLNGSGAFTLFDYRAAGDVVGGGDQSKFDSYAATGSFYGFGVNVSGTPANYFGNNIAANELYAHPANNANGDVILRYYAAASGLIEFNTTIRKAHFGVVDVLVLKNGSALQPTADTTSPVSFADTILLNLGDTVDFVIDREVNHSGDGTAILANAGVASTTGPTTVPEPGTLTVMAIALLGLTRLRKKV